MIAVLVHSTLIQARQYLDAFALGRFGTQKYAFEELVAELGAAFCCNELGIDSKLEHHASYLSNWIEVLKKDEKAFMSAAALASTAAKYLIKNAGIEQEAEQQNESVQAALSS